MKKDRIGYSVQVILPVNKKEATIGNGSQVSFITTSRSLEEPFKRTISRLYELTSMKYNI